LTGHEEQLTLWKRHAMLPTRREFYATPEYLQERHGMAQLWKELGNVTVARPSTVAGEHYDEVSRTYSSAVYSVLAGKQDPEKAMADLQTKLEMILGNKSHVEH